MTTIIMALVFNGALAYGYLKQQKFPSSISALWYTDVNLIYRFTVVGMSLLCIGHFTPFMMLAGMSFLGLLVFPKINRPTEKRVHDAFAILAFVFLSLEIHWGLIPILLLLCIVFWNLISLYWIEVIGFNIVILTKLLLS